MALESYEIVGSFNDQRVTPIDAERTINMFEYIDPLGKKPNTLISTSGLENSDLDFIAFGAAPTDIFRSSFLVDSFTYHVIGNNIFRIDPFQAITKINPSPLATSTGFVGVDANNAKPQQVMWVDGINGYIWDGTTFTVKNSSTDSSFPLNPFDICFLDGFLVIISNGTNTFQLSQLNEARLWGPSSSTSLFTVAGTPTTIITLTSGTSTFFTNEAVTVSPGSGGTLPAPLAANTTYFVTVLSPTTISLSTTIGGTAITLTTNGTPPNNITTTAQVQLGQVNSHPGTLVACRTLHRRIFFFSQFFTEVWENAGLGSNLPFRRNNSLLMEFGCASTYSIATGFDKMFFLSQDRDGIGSIMMVEGTQSMPVSTRALDFLFAQYDAAKQINLVDPIGFLIKDNGIIFYRLNFTLADVTYVYNLSMSDPQNNRWHEEQVLLGDRHLAQTHVFFNGINYFGSYLSPTLYVVDPNFVTNDGEAIPRIRIGKPYTPPTYQRLRIDRFHLDLVQGSVQEDADDVFPLVTETAQQDILTEEGDFLMTESSSQSDSDITIPAVDPVVFLSYSKDGGQSYGNRLIGPMGKIGERTFRTVWRKLGTIPRGQSFVPKIEFYNQLSFTILGAAWSYEVMPE